MKIPQQALALWGLEGAQITLIAARENAVYRVDHGKKRYAMRLHRQGYRTDSQLAAELAWMAMLADAGLSVPAPVASLGGTHLQHIGGMQLDLLNWLDGETLVDVLPGLDTELRRELFRSLGETMARMHIANDSWSDAAQCDRPAWDVAGLLGAAPLWDRFWENPSLSAGQKSLMQEFRARATEDLTALAPRLDYGLIHADLVPSNVMWSGTAIFLIDFDDGGFGFRLFEIATALLKLVEEPDFQALQAALIAGYRNIRRIDTDQLPLFMALRAATYVGWNITRMQEDETGFRNARFIRQAEDMIAAYLDI